MESTIVAWDGTSPSQRALEWAIAREGHRAGRIRLVRVVGESLARSSLPLVRDDRASCATPLETAAADVAESHPELAIDTELRIGGTLDELTALTGPSALLVVGTGVRRGPRRRYAFSLGARLAARAAGPVAVIPDRVEHDPALAAGVLVGVDDSAVSRDAALFGAAEAVLHGEPLRLVNAWQPPPLLADGLPHDDDMLDELTRAHEHIVQHLVDEIREEHPMLTVHGETVRATAGRALLHARPEPVLVVAGTRSTHGLQRLLLGSVSLELLLDIAGPTVIVPPAASASDLSPP